MTGRREWLRSAVELMTSASLWTSQTSPLAAQTPSSSKSKESRKERYTVRKPTVNSRDASRALPELGEKLVVPDDRLNRVLTSIRDAHHLPGIVGSIVRGQGLATIGAVGLRKISATDPIRVTDQVHIGSCTKAMTATLLGILVDEGLIRWDSTIGQVFPDLSSRLHPDCLGITLAHLLTHRAGLPHDAPWWRLTGRTTTEQRRTALRGLMMSPPASRPGSVYAYSNAGYVLAGLMAEQSTGHDWESLIRERLFEPLGMTSAGFGPPGRSRTSIVDQPWGHRDLGGGIGPVREDNAPCMGPAGTVHCTMSDWGKFVALHLRSEQGKPRLLTSATFRDLHTPPPGQEYAGGWYVFNRPWAGGQAFNHSGSNLSWYATVWIAPRRDFATLVATNQGGAAAESACEEASQALIRYAETFLTRRAGR